MRQMLIPCKISESKIHIESESRLSAKNLNLLHVLSVILMHAKVQEVLKEKEDMLGTECKDKAVLSIREGK